MTDPDCKLTALLQFTRDWDKLRFASLQSVFCFYLDFSAACTIISHERQHVVLWWFEAGPEVQDGVGGSKWA